MKVLRFGGSINAITVDTTLYLASDTELTVDSNNIVIDGMPFVLRDKSEIGSIKLRREINNKTYTADFDYIDIDGTTFIVIPVDTIQTIEGSKYEITVFDIDNNILYKGRAIYTTKDIQNYRL